MVLQLYYHEIICKRITFLNKCKFSAMWIYIFYSAISGFMENEEIVAYFTVNQFTCP